jgi:hypothetical protein
MFLLRDGPANELAFYNSEDYTLITLILGT